MFTYNFDKEKCWYKNTCNKFNTNECNSNCIRFMEMNYLMETSNIQKSKQFRNILVPENVDVKCFKKLAKIKNNIIFFVKNGENLYIFSERFGNGKQVG